MHDSVLDAISDSFGDNAAFALELYAQYRLNPGTVGDDWRRTFEKLEKAARVAAASGPATAPEAAAPAPATPAPAVVSRPAPSPRPGETPQPPAGGAPTPATWTPPSPSRPRRRSA